MRSTTEETLHAAWNIPNFDLSQFRKTCTRTWNTVFRHICSSGGKLCSEASVHTSLITELPSVKTQLTICCTVIFCVLCLVLIFYSHVLNKVSSYTVLVESCCDALHNQDHTWSKFEDHKIKHHLVLLPRLRDYIWVILTIFLLTSPLNILS